MRIGFFVATTLICATQAVPLQQIDNQIDELSYAQTEAETEYIPTIGVPASLAAVQVR